MHKLTLGQRGESIAAKYLTSLGFKIIEHNYRIGHLELDLIAIKNNMVYFFEIKTRQSATMFPMDNILSFKQCKNLKKASLTYLAQKKLLHHQFYFGLIFVLINLKTSQANITYYPNIF